MNAFDPLTACLIGYAVGSLATFLIMKVLSYRDDLY